MGRSLPEIALASNWAVRLDSLDLKPGSTFVSFTYLLIDRLKKKKRVLMLVPTLFGLSWV